MLSYISLVITLGIIITIFEIYFLYQCGKIREELDMIVEEARKRADESDNK